MKVALISDVHTNLTAWDALVCHWRTQSVDFEQVWSLGDWLGYGEYHPMLLWRKLNEGAHSALRGLRSNPSNYGVLGNHDLAVLGVDTLGCAFNDRAWSAIKQQQAYVDSSRKWKAEFAPWLSSQPLLLSPASGVYLAHGAFRFDNPYRIPCVYTPHDQPHEEGLKQIRAWLDNGRTLPEHVGVAIAGWHSPLILITGHTHQQRVWQRPVHVERNGMWLDADGAYPSMDKLRRCIESQETLEQVVTIENLSVQRPIWINPGSVGEQRNSNEPRPGEDWDWAKYAILEWDELESNRVVIRLRWVPYQRPSMGSRL